MFHTVVTVEVALLPRKKTEGEKFRALGVPVFDSHLKSLGAVEISDLSYIQELRRALQVVRTSKMFS